MRAYRANTKQHNTNINYFELGVLSQSERETIRDMCACVRARVFNVTHIWHLVRRIRRTTNNTESASQTTPLHHHPEQTRSNTHAFLYGIFATLPNNFAHMCVCEFICAECHTAWRGYACDTINKYNTHLDRNKHHRLTHQRLIQNVKPAAT